MRIFILRADASTRDAWERFARPCLDAVRDRLTGYAFVDSSTLGAEMPQRFYELMEAAPSDGIFLALCHGSEDALFMPLPTRCIDAEKLTLLKGKFCYLVACLAGRELGPLAVKNGADGFIGFSGRIYIVPMSHADAQRKALMSGLVAYLEGKPVPVAARTLKKTLLDVAKRIAARRANPLEDAPVIGHLTMIATLVCHEP